jgi:hypothetical protein
MMIDEIGIICTHEKQDTTYIKQVVDGLMGVV